MRLGGEQRLADWCRLRDAVTYGGGPGAGVDDAIGPDEDPSLAVRPVTWARLGESLDRIGLPWRLSDGHLVTVDEWHATRFALEATDPEDPDQADAEITPDTAGEVLVVRVQAKDGVPADWEPRALTATNEWNRTRRYLRAYLGPQRSDGQLSVLADLYLPIGTGLHDPLLDELLDSAAVAGQAWTTWLHNDALLL